MLIDDILEQLGYKMQTMPPEALVSILDFLYQMQDKLNAITTDLMARETKVDPGTIDELWKKSQSVQEMTRILSAKVGSQSRLGRCHLVGGAPVPAYSVPDSFDNAAADEGQPPLDKDQLLGLMEEEMQEE